MFDIALNSMVAQMISDLQHPDTFWQILVLLAILVLGKLGERSVRGRDESMSNMSRAARVGHGGLKRLVFPLLSLVLAVLARELLRPLIHVNLLSLAVPLLGSLAIIRFVFFILRVTFSNSVWLKNFELVFSSLVWGVVALHLSGFLPAFIGVLETVSFSTGKQSLNLWMILQGLLVVAGALLFSLWLGSLIDARLMRAKDLDNNLQVAFSRLSTALLILLAIMLALPAVGIDLTALSVFGGALGVGLGFGLQKIASNYVSGFIILLERSIRIGNIISVGADKGRVTKITTRYTVIRAGNGVEALVPNEALVSSTVQSDTYSDTWVRYTLPVQISYEDNPEDAMALLLSLAKAHPDVLADPEPLAFVVLFADSGINLELWFWVAAELASWPKVRSDLNVAIWKAFAEAGISIPFPQREVRLLGSANSLPTADKG